MSRVTEGMMFENLNLGVMRSQQRLYDSQRRAQTGERVTRPSDDPVVATHALAIDGGLRRLDGMDRAASQADQELMAAEAALSETEAPLTRAREIALQAANETLAPGQRAMLAQEIAAIRETLLGVGNTQISGIYVFGGYRTNAPPFQSDGTYTGDDGVRRVEVAPGMRASVNVTGAVAFGSGGASDVFGLLQALHDDMVADNPTAIRGRLTELDTARDQFTSARSKLAAAMTLSQAATQTRGDLAETLQTSRADVVEMDAAEAYSEMLQAQNAFQAAIAQATRILSGLGSIT